MSRSTLPYVILVSALVFVVAGILYGIIESGVAQELMATSAWQSGSSASQLARGYVEKAWIWLPLVILLRIGLELVITARDVASTGSGMIPGTMTLFLVHLFMLVWMLAIPAMVDPVISIALDAPIGDYKTPIRYARDLALVNGPAVLLVAGDLWFLSAPIRADAQSGYRY